MMVANNSFDLWQKDSFFSAAEEVQDSADIMESVYRTWIRRQTREREGEGVEGEDLVELRRELQTVLGTAKWQLEEFERAVRLSHGCRPEVDATSARHYQFVAAIEDQINRVQLALRESVSDQGNQPLPFRWVQLDQEERDDLAAFLSATAPSSQLPKPSTSNNSSSMGMGMGMGPQVATKHVSIHDALHSSYHHSNQFTKHSNYILQLQPNECPTALEDTNYQSERLNGQRTTWSTPNFATCWKIVIADDTDQHKNNNALEAPLPLPLPVPLDSTPKGKGFKTGFWKLKPGEHLDLSCVNNLTQLLGQLPRQLQTLQHMQFTRSLRIVLFIMLTIFLIVPFMLYSN